MGYRRLAALAFGLTAVVAFFLGGGVLMFGGEVVPGGETGGGVDAGYRLEPGEAPPRFVEHHVIDLERVDRVSKFRGAYGHDYSESDDETCRSMKHYFRLKQEDAAYRRNTTYYAPAEGRVVSVEYEGRSPDDARVQIVSAAYPSVVFRFHHIDPSVEGRERVTAGEPIGHIATTGTDGEIAVAQYWPNESQQISFYRIADESVFAAYRERGVESRSQLIISQDHRDEHPLVCGDDGHRFVGRSGVDESRASFHQWVRRTQFVDLD